MYLYEWHCYLTYFNVRDLLVDIFLCKRSDMNLLRSFVYVYWWNLLINIYSCLFIDTWLKERCLFDVGGWGLLMYVCGEKVMFLDVTYFIKKTPGVYGKFSWLPGGAVCW